MSNQNQQQAQAPTTSHLFLDLPPSSVGRSGDGLSHDAPIQSVDAKLPFDPSSAQDSFTKNDSIWTFSSVPVVLHINRESRAIALGHYQLLFDLGTGPNIPRATPVYYNPDLDIACLIGHDLTPNTTGNLASELALSWLATHFRE